MHIYIYCLCYVQTASSWPSVTRGRVAHHPVFSGCRCFKHYMYFVYEFDLIPRKEELAPLQELIDKLMERDTQQFAKEGASADAAAEN